MFHNRFNSSTLFSISFLAVFFVSADVISAFVMAFWLDFSFRLSCEPGIQDEIGIEIPTEKFPFIEIGFIPSCWTSLLYRGFCPKDRFSLKFKEGNLLPAFWILLANSCCFIDNSLKIISWRFYK